MPTNVYLTTKTNHPVDLVLNHVGPSHDFDKGFHQKQTSVPGSSKGVYVLEIDRGGEFHVGDAVGVTELQLWMNGVFVAALQVLLDNLTEPVKNEIFWSWRVPGPKECRWSSSHDPLTVDYANDTTIVSDFTVQGKSTTGFDDIELTLEAVGNSYDSLTVERDEQGSRLIAFAVNDVGGGIVATAPMLESDSPSDLPVPAWATWGFEVSQGWTLVGSPSVIRGVSGPSPAYLGALATGNQLWIGSADDVYGKGTLLPLGLPGDRYATDLTFGDVWTSAGQSAVDVFATVEDGSTSRLYYRVLTLSSPPALQGDWDDWGTVASAPSWLASAGARYLFTASKSILSTPYVYYASAAWDSSRWSGWSALPSLPTGAAPVTVTGANWWDKGKPQKEVAVVCADNAGDGWLYSFDSASFGWLQIGSGIVGGIQVTPITNTSAIAARVASGLMVGEMFVKERIGKLTESVPDSSAYGAYAPVFPFLTVTQWNPHSVAIVRHSDTDAGPTAVPVRTISSEGDLSHRAAAE